MYYTSKEVYEFISKQTNDPIIEWKKCRVSGADFPIYQTDLNFYDKISPKFETDREIGEKLIADKPDYFSRDKHGKLKVKIPTPTLCPEERQRRRLMFRNERRLYKRKCDATGESIISIYSPDKPYKVYNQKVWWSDDWERSSISLENYQNSSFVKNMNNLFSLTPKLSLIGFNIENSDYSNQVLGAKNCYLVFSGFDIEDCLYGRNIRHSQWVVDWLQIARSNNIFKGVVVLSSYNVLNSFHAISCSNSSYLEYCEWCNYCFWCYNLINKSYCIFNKQYTKKEYNKELLIAEKMSHEYITTFLSKRLYLTKNCIFNQSECYSEFTRDSTNVHLCINIAEGETFKYCQWCEWSKDLYDVTISWSDCFLNYESIATWVWSSCLIWTYNGTNIQYCLYCFDCFNSQNLFSCIWLHNKQYCIFNKQYSKEEYNNLVPQIINQMIDEWSWGEFFDPSLSPFGYNETVAQEYFPLTREEALARWYKRQDNNYDPVVPEWVETLTWDQIPADISTVTDDVLKKIFVCEVSGRPFRIIKQELDFYRKHNIPLPRKHPDVRHQERLAQRPPRELHLRHCDKCGKEMVSVYDKDFEWKVYCEECYQKEVYG